MLAQSIDTACPSPTHKYKRKIPVNEALRFRLINGLSFTDIAKIYNVSQQAVSELLTKYINRLDVAKQAKAFSDNEINLYKYIESELALDLLCPEKRAKASINNIAYAVQQVNNARRLAEGKSTANIDCRSVIVKANDELEAIRAEIARRKAKAIDVSEVAGPPDSDAIEL